MITFVLIALAVLAGCVCMLTLAVLYLLERTARTAEVVIAISDVLTESSS